MRTFESQWSEGDDRCLFDRAHAKRRAPHLRAQQRGEYALQLVGFELVQGREIATGTPEQAARARASTLAATLSSLAASDT